MKNVFRNQKQLARLAVFGLLSIMSACNSSEPEPALADQITGDYTVTSYKSGVNTVNLPATTSTGITATARIVGSKVNENTASFVFIFTQIKSGVQSSSTSKLENLSLKKGSSGEIEGYNGASKDVTYKNSELTLTFADSDPSKVLVIYAKKD